MIALAMGSPGGSRLVTTRHNKRESHTCWRLARPLDPGNAAKTGSSQRVYGRNARRGFSDTLDGIEYAPGQQSYFGACLDLRDVSRTDDDTRDLVTSETPAERDLTWR